VSVFGSAFCRVSVVAPVFALGVQQYVFCACASVCICELVRA